jgi:hypothetical protein
VAAGVVTSPAGALSKSPVTPPTRVVQPSASVQSDPPPAAPPADASPAAEDPSASADYDPNLTPTKESYNPQARQGTSDDERYYHCWLCRRILSSFSLCTLAVKYFLVFTLYGWIIAELHCYDQELTPRRW